MRKFGPVLCILAASISSLYAENFVSATSGNWNSTSLGTWTPNGDPNTGGADNVSILTGHTVFYTGESVGLPGSGDLGTAGGSVISIDGGILSQTTTGNWVRIGQSSAGTMNINDGAFYFTNTVGTGQSPNVQVGVAGAAGAGVINIGDGIGAAGSALFDLRRVISGAENNITVSMNLASDSGGSLSGTIVVNSDGILEGDVRTAGGASNPVIRVGQAITASHALSSITVQGGGTFNAHGTVELGSANQNAEGHRSNGMITITGIGSVMNQDGGELNVGWNGDGAMLIDNGGTYSKTNNAGNRLDVIVGRDVNAIGTVTVQNGGQFLRGAGSDVGDMRIGLRGRGTMTINNGGLVQNDTGNWDWIGEQTGGNGTLNVNAGGIFRTTAGSNFNIGVNTGATGLVVINGGLLDLQSTGAAQIRLAQNGTGTFRQIAGTTNAQLIQMAENSGNATFDLQGGTITLRAQFFMGGATTGSTGTGTATGTQSGGTLTVPGAFVVGLAGGHTATYTMTGGVVNHTGSDLSIGESGSGSMTIGAGATFNDTSATGAFFVGRNDGSAGTLFVDGTLDRLATTPIRVGNGNPAGEDNTTGTGVLGGTGSINAPGGIRVGINGTLTGGSLASVGHLTVQGSLDFSSGGLLYANFNTSGGADRITLTGTVDIAGAILGGEWTGGLVGPDSRYWLLVNDGFDDITGTFGNASPTSPNAGLFPDAEGWVTIGSQEFAVFYHGDFDTNGFTGGNDLLLAAVPEPNSILLLGSAFALGIGHWRRRQDRHVG